jgi:ABC-2 type transport system permease protein
MRRTFIIAGRVVRQLIRNPRLLVLSVAAPLAIVYFFKIFFDTLPPTFGVARYAVPVAAFVVHFLAFLLCAIALVQERTMGTMERMFINGFRRTEIIAGYVLGFLGLATFQAVAGLAEAIWLFDLDYEGDTLAMLFVVVWLLAIASVMLASSSPPSPATRSRSSPSCRSSSSPPSSCRDCWSKWTSCRPGPTGWGTSSRCSGQTT